MGYQDFFSKDKTEESWQRSNRNLKTYINEKFIYTLKCRTANKAEWVKKRLTVVLIPVFHRIKPLILFGVLDYFSSI